MHSVWLFLHLGGVIVWVGGMFFAHFCLRPVLAEQLPPAQRLPLLAAVLGRFFNAVVVSIAAILISGFGRMLQTGFAEAPVHWHVMAAFGLLMALVFALIYLRFYAHLRAMVAIQDWPAAGAIANRIRQLVATNLLLGALTVGVASFGSFFGR